MLESKCSKHPGLGILCKLRCRKSAHFEVEMPKSPLVRTTFGSSDVEKVHAAVARSTFPSQNCRITTCSNNFWTFKRRSVADAMDSAPCQKVTQRLGLADVSETMEGTAHLKRMSGCIRCDRRSTRDISSRHAKRSGR